MKKGRRTSRNDGKEKKTTTKTRPRGKGTIWKLFLLLLAVLLLDLVRVHIDTVQVLCRQVAVAVLEKTDREAK